MYAKTLDRSIINNALNVDEIIKILNEKGFDSDDKELP